MLKKLTTLQTANLRPMLTAMDIHLPIAAIFSGDISGEFYADDPEQPRFALTWTGHRFYLLGSPPQEADLPALGEVFLETFQPEARALGKDLFYIHYPLGAQQRGWEEAIGALLSGRDPVQEGHQYYAWDLSPGRLPDWRARLPLGIELQPVDASLLVPRRIQNPDYLTDEMLSERPSVEEYLAKSFGVCLVHAGEITGWCLSEYNTGSRCEVGIATREDFRRRGLATLMAQAFCEQALAHGITQVGWHCSANNLPSGKTALRAGFHKVADYPIFLGWFDPAINLAQNGYIALFAERYPDSLAFFERAFAVGGLPDWAYYGGACAAARLGQLEQALNYLDQAVARGFADVERLQSSAHLAGLHEHPRWRALLERLATAG